MSPHRVHTPETSPEPEPPQYQGPWRATGQKRKQSCPAAGVEEPGRRGGIRALWEGEWRSACQESSHPFQDGRPEDFEPIFNDLIAGHVDDAASPQYTLAFLPKAHELALKAEDALLRGDRALATGFFLRACAVLRIARYHPPGRGSSCAAKQRAWRLQKSLYLKAGRLWESPLDEVVVPHIYDSKTHAGQHAARSGVRDRGEKPARVHRPRIPLCVRLPPDTLRTGRPCAAVLIVSDDRTAHTEQCEEALGRGWGCVVAEVPGAGDCPVPVPEAEGGEAADGLWSSVLSWMGAIRVFDMDRLVAWGPAGAVVRMAGTHGDRLSGCVARLGCAGGEDLSMLDEVSCRLLLVTGGDSAVESNGLWTPVVERHDEGRLALFEYGVLGTSVVQHPVADMWTVYKWVGDIIG